MNICINNNSIILMSMCNTFRFAFRILHLQFQYVQKQKLLHFICESNNFFSRSLLFCQCIPHTAHNSSWLFIQKIKKKSIKKQSANAHAHTGKKDEDETAAAATKN